MFKTRTSKKMTDIDAHHMKAIFFSYTVIYWHNTCLRSSFFWLIFLFNFFFIILYELPCTNPIPQQLTTSDRLILWYLVLQDISLEQPLGLLPCSLEPLWHYTFSGSSNVRFAVGGGILFLKETCPIRGCTYTLLTVYSGRANQRVSYIRS